MADGEGTAETAAEEVAETVAPDSVTEGGHDALGGVLDRLEGVVDKLTGVVQSAAPAVHPESVAAEVHETTADDIPIRKPWTHRVPFARDHE